MKAKWIPLSLIGGLTTGLALLVGLGTTAGWPGNAPRPAPAAARVQSGPIAPGGAAVNGMTGSRDALLSMLAKVARLDGAEPVSVSGYPISALASAERDGEKKPPVIAAPHKVTGVVMSPGGPGAAVIDDRVRQEGDVLADGTRVVRIRPGLVVLVGPTGETVRHSVTQSYTPPKPVSASGDQEQP